MVGLVGLLEGVCVRSPFRNRGEREASFFPDLGGDAKNFLDALD